VIDRGLVLWFPGPASFTGEDMAELQVHGGRAVSKRLSDSLIALGAQPAEAGAFTRRAVLNGKMDLTQAESILDLVEAETDRQRVRALEQSGGALSRQVEQWRTDLIKAAGYLEATIDFAEEDIPDDLMNRVKDMVRTIQIQMTDALSQSVRGERLREGLAVAIVGAPNAGKSSLLNQIAGRDAAIVSHVAGTTRDVIEVDLDLNGWPVILSDTAGLRDAADEVEQEGIRRARLVAERSDVKLVVLDASRLPDLDVSSLSLVDDTALVVLNKIDRVADYPPVIAGKTVLAVSAETGQGINDVLMALESSAESAMSGEAIGFGRARHRAALTQAVEALLRFDPSIGVELAAEDIRLAATAIARITGAIVADDILDVVFREFCIGK
jgi:tRNA modification GTPase